MSRNSLLVRVRQVASPHKMARARLERVQKINKVSKSLFGPVIKSEFEKFAQLEMTKYQLQASNKWNFDFMKESPIRNSNSQFTWETVKLNETPKFYHHEFISQAALPLPSLNQNDCENIWPLTPMKSTNSIITSPALVIHNSLVANNRKIVHSVITSASSNFVASSAVCNKSQRKITDYLKVRKRRMSTTTSAVCLKKARADF